MTSDLVRLNENLVSLFLLTLRISSVFLVSTWYVPDEYWQSLEVAHRMVFGYGYQTWEWKEGIRSYIHPLIIAFFYKILWLFNADHVEFLIFGPRILQSILSAYSDYCFWRWSGKTKWSLFLISTSWFWFYTASRTLSNTLEASLTTIGVSRLFSDSNDTSFLWFMGISIAIRPTAAIVWLPLVLYHVYRQSIQKVFRGYITIGLTVIVLSTLIDSICHGRLIITWFEFLRFNFISSGGDFYGTHPWHWYLSSGLPAVLGIDLIPFIITSIYILKNRAHLEIDLILIATITFTIFMYSLIGHKEFRFILSVLPICLHVTSKYLTIWSRKANNLTVSIAASTILISNLILIYYFGQIHQAGPNKAMTFLEHNLKSDENVLFLMPCHSTPFYSHVHKEVDMRFLTCNPPNLNHSDEAEHFYANPNVWLRSNYPPEGKLPTYLVLFDVLSVYIGDILSRYQLIQNIYHMQLPPDDPRIGKSILIYKRLDFV